MSPGEQKLRDDMKTALRAKDALRTQILRAVLAAAKNPCASAGMPTANMWCTHNPKLRKPVLTSETTTQV